jgi:hypothetical protein
MLNELKVGEGVPNALGESRYATRDVSSTVAKAKRWSAGRKRQIALRLIRDESVDVLSSELGVPDSLLKNWHNLALAGIKAIFNQWGKSSHRRTTHESRAFDRQSVLEHLGLESFLQPFPCFLREQSLVYLCFVHKKTARNAAKALSIPDFV